MNPKKFKLPKEFAEKWIEALKSGDYKQGHSMLATTDVECFDGETLPPIEKCSFCCLGVAAKISGNPVEELIGVEYLYSKKAYKGIPEELLTEYSGNDQALVWTLSQLNDGMSRDTYIEEFKDKAYNFRIDIEQHFTKEGKLESTFEDIVNFIKDNVEFY